MYIHASARAIYLAHPRTASNATVAALREVGFEKAGPPSDHHGRLWDGSTPVTPETRSDWLVFTAVRNHYDAAVSWLMRNSVGREMLRTHSRTEAFRTVLSNGNRWVRERSLWWLHSDDADRVMRYEQLEQDLAEVLAELGLPAPQLPRVNVTDERAARPHREFYDEAAREYVAGRFGREMEAFGYEF